MPICMACGEKEASYHITVNIGVFGPKSTRPKIVQFIICVDCELALQQVLAKDVQQKFRVARRLIDTPEFLSDSPTAWQHKRKRQTFTDWAEQEGRSPKDQAQRKQSIE
jgi:hypothetical protein